MFPLGALCRGRLPLVIILNDFRATRCIGIEETKFVGGVPMAIPVAIIGRPAQEIADEPIFIFLSCPLPTSIIGWFAQLHFFARPQLRTHCSPLPVREIVPCRPIHLIPSLYDAQQWLQQGVTADACVRRRHAHVASPFNEDRRWQGKAFGTG